MSVSPVYERVRPQLLDEQPRALCMEGITPGMITAALLWLVRYHFSSADRIVDHTLKGRIWSTRDGIDTEETSKLLVEPASRWKVDSVQQRPGVFIRRQPWELAHLAMFGSVYQGSDDPDRERVERDVTGSHTIFCVSKAQAEAEGLAWEIVGQLEGFSTKIVDDMELSTLRVVGMQDPAPLVESETHWAVAVNVGYAFHRAWYTQQVAKQLSGFHVGIQED